MAFYHLSMSALQRSKGRSAIASVAYITADKMHDARQDMVFNYRRKESVLFSDTILPNGKAIDKSELWNSVELHHKRGDAVTARTIDIALPNELSPDVILELSKEVANKIAKDYSVGLTYAIHRSAEEKNVHMHVNMTACKVSENAELGKKVEALDPIHCKRNNIGTVADELRPYWANLCNEYLAKNGIQQTIDHRSNTDRGIDAIPTIHVGHYIDSPIRAEINNQIRITNNARKHNKENAIEKAKTKKPEIAKYSDKDITIKAQELLTVAKEGRPKEALAQWEQYHEEAIQHYVPVVKKKIHQQDIIDKQKIDAITEAHDKDKLDKPEWTKKPDKELPKKKPAIDIGKQYEKLATQWEQYNSFKKITKERIEIQKSIQAEMIERRKPENLKTYATGIVYQILKRTGVLAIIETIRHLAQAKERGRER